MDYWLYLNDVEADQLVAVAQEAERVGFRGVGVADHIAVPRGFDPSAHPSGHAPFDHRSPFPDPIVTAATILAATERLEVMSYVLVLPMREPFSVAKQAGTLALLSKDRFRLGVGAGWMLEEIELLGHPVPGRGRRLDEMLEIMRGFWTEEAYSFHGEFFDFSPAGMAPRPAKPVPVWVGGKSRHALERATRQDGWLGMNYELDEIETMLRTLHALRADDSHARSPSGDFEVFVIPNAEPSPTLHDDLEGQGVTGTMGFAWPGEDPRFEPLEAKRDALAQFAETYINR